MKLDAADSRLCDDGSDAIHGLVHEHAHRVHARRERRDDLGGALRTDVLL
jgi:hypothetical protein